ncbi:MAG: transglutaminaseTgpA domain-containing protein [Candidatus Hydrogenedentes bacterium]|nr:transglutaminaseTgpA domain-containing protein [Candidatus Hydrogenedentota bacterium]
MSTVRLLALLMVLVAAAVLARMSGQIIFPAVVCAAAFVGVWDRVAPRVPQRMEVRLAMAVAVVFLLRWLLLPAPRLGVSGGYTSIGILDYSRAYPIAQALLTWQVMLLFLRRGDGFPRVLPVYAVLVMIMAGTFPAAGFDAWRDGVFQAGSLAIAALTGVYFTVTTPRNRTGERPARGTGKATVAILAVVLALGWGLGTAFYRYGDRFDQRLAEWLSERNAPAAMGFPDNGRIGSISSRKSLDSDYVALRVTSESSPDYLRGKAYDTYASGSWTSAETFREIDPVDGAAPVTAPSQHWFSLAPANEMRAKNMMTVERVLELEGTLFTRLESEYVSANANPLKVDRHDVPLSNQVMPGLSYSIAGTFGRGRPITLEDRESFVATPRDLDARIQELAEAVTSECATDAERVNAVVWYVQQTCSYDLRAGAGASRDPVVAFLFETRRGHCELFASSVVLLLRAAGVPCRYATGFLAAEQNTFGEYWVARNRDAHAWVEVYFPDRGWVTVEATPPSGVPRGTATWFAQLWDFAGYAPQRLLTVAQTLRLSRFISSVAVIFVVLLLTSAIVWRLWRSRRAVIEHPEDPAVIALHRLLQKMDRTLNDRGLVRADIETLHGFARRVEAGGDAESAGWYRMYAEARYGMRGEVAERLVKG